MNITLALQAMQAVIDPDFEDDPGYCQRFAREVRQAALGHGYDQYDRPAACDAGEALRDAGFAVDTLSPGCLLYKTFRPFGHVGIYVGDRGDRHDLVAENSSTSVGRVRGAAGYRQYPEEWGVADIIVELPDPNAATIRLPDGNILRAWGTDHILTPVRAWAAALGLPVGWVADPGRATVGGRLIDEQPFILDGTGWLSIRALAATAGLHIAWDGEARQVTVTKG